MSAEELNASIAKWRNVAGVLWAARDFHGAQAAREIARKLSEESTSLSQANPPSTPPEGREQTP